MNGTFQIQMIKILFNLNTILKRKIKISNRTYKKKGIKESKTIRSKTRY